MSKNFLITILLLFLLTACKEASNLLHKTIVNKPQNSKKSILALKACKLNKAMSIVNNENQNSLLKNSELGLGNYFNNNYIVSNKHLDIAINEYRNNEDKAIFDISTFLKKEYQIEGYDKVLLHNYKAINYLLLGDAEAARVEAKNSNIIQYREREKLNKFKKENSKKNQNTQLYSRYEKLFNHVNAEHNPFQNPFAYYISALAYAEDKDYENALIDIEKAKKFFPNTEVLTRKQKIYENKEDNKSIELFFDIGQAPLKSQVALKLDIGNGETRTAYLPSFHLEISDVDYICIKDNKGNEVARTSLLVDINAIKINAFKEKLPSMLYLISEQVTISLTSSKLNSNSKAVSGLFNAGAVIYGQNSTSTWSFLPQKTLVTSFIPKASEEYSMFVVSKNGETLDKKLLILGKYQKTKNIYRHFNIPINKFCIKTNK